MILAATNKCLAQKSKSRTSANATTERSNWVTTRKQWLALCNDAFHTMKKLAAPMKSFGSLILMTLIYIVVFWIFMALRPASAGMQGNLPTPVQALPKYPPVACVAPNWETESCEHRQTPLPTRNPLRAFARPPSNSKTVLRDEPGGDYWQHWWRFKRLADSGDDVEIRGSCASGCTLVMLHVPNDRLCFGEKASLKFHIARNKDGVPDAQFTEKMMVNEYPQDIRAWIIAKGGVEKMNIWQMWELTAEELWTMGYRKCDPEEPLKIVPMAETDPVWQWDAMKNYRPIWN
jgi:hypothetical protein